MGPEYSLEGLMLKLKLQYSGHLMWRSDSLGKTLMLGKIKGRRRTQQRIRWLDGISWLDEHNFEQASGVGEGQGKPSVLQSIGSQRVRHNWSDLAAAAGLQPTRLPCPSPTPRTYSNSCPSSWWCHPAISSFCSNHPYRPLLLLPLIFPSIRVFSNESVLHIKRPKY